MKVKRNTTVGEPPYLEGQGFRVMRVGNDDVLQDLEAVLAAILLECGIDPESGKPAPSPGVRPSSPKGRGV